MLPGGSREEAQEVVDGAARVPPDPTRDSGARDRARRDERAGPEELPSLEDLDDAERLARPDGEADGGSRDDALRQRPVDADCADEGAARDETDGTAPVCELGVRVDPPRPDDGESPVARETPAEERREVVVPPRARRAAEAGGVQREPVCRDGAG